MPESVALFNAVSEATMLRLGTKVWYGGREAFIVARTLEREAKYDLLFPDTRQIQPYIPGHSLDLTPGDGPAFGWRQRLE
jgi:hypothetical protein